MSAEHLQRLMERRHARRARAAQRMAQRRASHLHRTHRSAAGTARHPMTRYHKRQHTNRAGEHAMQRHLPNVHPFHVRQHLKQPKTARLALLSAHHHRRLVGYVHTHTRRHYKGRARFVKRKTQHRVWRKNTGHRPTRHL
jgi:hypothetical protein